MQKFLIAMALFSGLGLSALAAPAPAPPKVVFIGDWVTQNWAAEMSPYPNWINEGSFIASGIPEGTAAGTLARFQADVVSLHPAIVHIMVGGDDSLEGTALPDFVASIAAMVQEAKAANIKVILGNEPCATSFLYTAAVAGYGATNNIPVLNYGGALCPGNSLSQGTAIGYAWAAPASEEPGYFLLEDYEGYPSPSEVGYLVMNQMVQSAITAITTNPKLKGGYLQNVEQPATLVFPPPVPIAVNVNTVTLGSVVQFAPSGYYSDGSTQVLFNTDLAGSNGTWTSSNPLVMFISPSGQSWAITPGTAIIHYTAPNGVAFSEWIMYVKAGP
jgi:hypothetical protein